MLYTLSTLFSKGVGFLMLPVYTAFFTPSDFGVMDLLLVTGQVLSVVLGMELNQAVARFYPDANSFKDQQDIVSTAFWAVNSVVGIFLLIGFINIKWISTFFIESGLNDELLKHALLSYAANFIFYYTSAQLRWQLKALQNLAVNITYTFLAASTTVLMIKYYNLNVEAVFIAQTYAAIVGSILSILLSLKSYTFQFNKAVYLKLIKFSAPLIVSTLTVYGMLYVDRLLITYFLKPDDLGYYAFSSRIASFVSLLTIGVQTALGPIIYTHYKDEKTKKILARLFNYYVMASFVFILILYLSADWLVNLMGHGKFTQSKNLIVWLSFSVLISSYVNFHPGMYIKNKTHEILYINLFSFLLNLCAGLWLVRSYGLFGAVLSTAVSSFCYYLLYCIRSQRYYFIPFFWTLLTNKEASNRIN